MLLVLAMSSWCIYTGINMFLSVISSSLVIGFDHYLSDDLCDEQIQSKGRKIQGIPTDIQILKEDRIQDASTITSPPTALSVMDAQPMPQTEHRRDVRISVVEKGCRRQL